MRDPRVDAYLSRLPDDQRRVLGSLRERLHRLVPDAVETISYGMPALRQGGDVVVWFAGWKRFCSLYPLTDTFLRDHSAEAGPYLGTKGSLHFTGAAPLPDPLVAAFVKARLEDLARERSRP
jgi:uncharacterized protein YdhG (YjbR/CyaY superfamily)